MRHDTTIKQATADLTSSACGSTKDQDAADRIAFDTRAWKFFNAITQRAIRQEDVGKQVGELELEIFMNDE